MHSRARDSASLSPPAPQRSRRMHGIGLLPRSRTPALTISQHLRLWSRILPYTLFMRLGPDGDSALPAAEQKHTTSSTSCSSLRYSEVNLGLLWRPPGHQPHLHMHQCRAETRADY